MEEIKIPKSWSEDYQYEVFKALLQRFDNKWSEELEGNDDVRIAHIGEFEREADEIIKNRGKVKGIASGYPSIDRLTEGFDKGELVVVSGSTATGKTLFCLNMIINSFLKAKQTFSTLIFTLEMTKPQIAARIKGILEGTDYENELQALPIHFYASKSDPTIATMRKAIDKCKEKNGLDLIVIDHLHYFSRSVESQVAEIGILVREIKRIAVDYNIPVLLIAHTRKRAKGEAKDNKTNIDDLKDSAAIGQDADIVIMLNRDKLDQDRNHILDVTVEKTRNKGQVGGTEMHIQTPQFRLYEMEEYYANFGQV